MEAVLQKNIRIAAGDQILGAVDPELLETIRAERGRQCDQIELIASENYVSDAVLVAQGFVPSMPMFSLMQAPRPMALRIWPCSSRVTRYWP